MSRIAIVSPNRAKYSETFIHSHVHGLAGVVQLLYGDYLPTHFTENLVESGNPFLSGLMKWDQNEDRNKNRLRKAITKRLKASKIDVVLAEYGPTGVEMAPLCEATGIPLIVHFHGFDAYREDVLRDFGSEYGEMFRIAAGIVVVSEDMKAQLMDFGAPETKLHLIPYGIELANFEVKFEKTDQPVLVSCGRFVEKKAPHLTLLAFNKVKAEVPDARLVMIGEGHLLDACKVLARGLGIEEAVEFKGVLSPREVAQQMAVANVFVQHSLTTPKGDKEGMPLAILEAMASGLPVVATRHAGIPEAVEVGKSGSLVAEGDVNGMADLLVQMLKDKPRAQEYGALGRKIIAERYTLTRYLEALSKLLGL